MNDPKDKGEPFLSRWARRKQDAARGRIDDAVRESIPAGDQPEAADAAPAREAEKEPELDLSKLPKAEELTAESDITAFLDKRVPAMLRNAALGRMWTLDPTIRDFIEVAENQWNWNIPGGAPFYEPIESVVESVGEIVAQVGNQAVSLSGNKTAQAFESPSVTPGAETACARVEPADTKLKDKSRSFEGAAAPTAPQNDPHKSDDGTTFAVAIDDAYVSGTSSEVSGDAAPQHLDAQVFGNRRRHGGALPS